MIVWWIKQDFRLSDNPALHRALEAGEPVLALYVLEPSNANAAETSGRHLDSQLTALRALRSALRRSGGDCCAIEGEVVPTLQRLHAQHSLRLIVSHEETGLWRTYQRDLAVAEWCRTAGVRWVEVRQTGVFRRLIDRDQRSDYWKRWMSDGPIAAPVSNDIGRISIPSAMSGERAETDRLLDNADCVRHWSTDTTTRHLQRVTEIDAYRVLHDFLDRRSIDYSGGISSPNTAFRAGSRLSVHLAWGTITAREVYTAVLASLSELGNGTDERSKLHKKSLRAFLARLHWRDHFTQRLESEPTMEFHALNRAYDALDFNRDPELLQAWIEGQTGYPMVDACLRCARATGFLNFRMRCLITSFACHSLRLDWRDILWPMARWWTDYAPGIHVAQLQMQAGVVGINTLRVYSPVKQMLDHDPEARFVRRWVPELKRIDTAAIADHTSNPVEGYATPIVDWRTSSAQMKERYYAIRRMPATKALAADVLEVHGSRKPASARKRPGVR